MILSELIPAPEFPVCIPILIHLLCKHCEWIVIVSLWFQTLSHAESPTKKSNGQKWGRGLLVGPTLSVKGCLKRRRRKRRAPHPPMSRATMWARARRPDQMEPSFCCHFWSVDDNISQCLGLWSTGKAPYMGRGTRVVRKSKASCSTVERFFGF